MMRSYVPLCSRSSPAHLAGHTGLCLSRSVSAKQSGWLQNFWTDAGTCVHRTNTCARHQPLWPATWNSASLTYGQAYHKTSSMKQLVTGHGLGPSMGWVGLGQSFFKFLVGWVGWRLDCVIFLTSWNTLLSVNEYCSWIITFIDSWLVELVCDV